MPKENYIIFSSIDWLTHWQIHHQLSQSLSLNGNKVLFIENTGIRSINLKDRGRLVERLANWKNSLHGYREVEHNIVTYSPLLLPFPYSKIAIFINKILLRSSLSSWLNAANFYNPIVISFLPTPVVQDALIYIKPIMVIYYCANNFSDSSSSAKNVLPYEDDFIRSSDMTFVISESLRERASSISKNIHYFPPGIDFKKFNNILLSNEHAPDDLRYIKSPIIGYVGSISRVFDQDLVLSVANQLSEFTVVLVGPKYTDTSLLENVSNIIFVGHKSYDLIPKYIKNFDICIIPYICNDFTDGVFPTKLIEYLSMGKPVVTTGIRELTELPNSFKESFTIANNTSEFISNIVTLSKEDDLSIRSNRIKIAKSNSWEIRFNNILEVIEGRLTLVKSNSSKISWKKNFIKLFLLNKKVKKIMFIIAFSFLIIFYSPMFWFAGEQLIVSDSPKKSDAIVVFSGDGKVSYQNLGYQMRALDATKLFKDGYADKIFLSSGREQTIADVEMIKLYLVSKGVPDLSIHILEKYPNSTYQNAIMVKESLEKNNIKSILFTTSPYHSRRAVLTWEKNAPNIEVVSFNAVNPLYKGVQWNISLDKIRIIVYEYAAIVHNWLVGRI